MKTKLLLLAFAILLFSQAVNAQVSAYTFSQFPGTYVAAANPTLIGTPLQNDDTATLALPFPFVFNAVTYTAVTVCSNGYMGFSGLSGNEFLAISDMTTSNIIAPFSDDLLMVCFVQGDLSTGSNSITNCTSVTGFSIGDVLFDWNGDFGGNPVITNISGNVIEVSLNAINTIPGTDIVNLSSSLAESVSGTAPNRIYEIEYSKMSRFFVPDESITFKVRLYETSNVIEFSYGDCVSGFGFSNPEVGLKGLANDFNSRQITFGVNNWNTSSAATIITDFCDFNSSTFPANGQIYQWTPLACTAPVLAVAASQSVSCSGQSVQLTANGATTYTWVNGPASAQHNVSPTSTTQYTLLGANQTCTAALVYTAVVVPTPSLIITQPATVICKGQSTTLTAQGASSYTWNGIGGTANFVLVPTNSVLITVAGSNGACVSTQTVVQKVSTCFGVEEETTSTNHAFEVYPNPFSDKLLIKNTTNVALTASMFDATGRLVQELTLKEGEAQSLDSSELAPGVYIVSISGEGYKEAKRIVKH